MDATPTFLFAGGGTGGHLFPGLAVVETLLRRDAAMRCLFVGSGRDVELQIVKAAGCEHIALSSPPSTRARRHPLRFLRDYHRARRTATALLKKLRPQAVIGLGGFACVPVVRAARRNRVPVILLEQNAIAGRATHWLSRRAAAVCHTFAEAVPPGRRGRNTIITGNPVRRIIAELAASKSVPCDDNGNRRPTLLILGGSQGSTAVNTVVLKAAESLNHELRGWHVLHQAGPRDADRVMTMYTQFGIEHTVATFFDDLPARYAVADVAVSRAGATTLAELACAGVPALLIPYPKAVKNHQQRNAEVFVQFGDAGIVTQNQHPEKTARDLAAMLRPLLVDEALRRRQSAAMRSLARPDAAERVADCVLAIASGRSPQHCEPRPGAPHFAELIRDSPHSPKSS